MSEQPYPVLTSSVDRRSDEYQRNLAAGQAAVAKLEKAHGEAIVGGGEKYTSRHKAAGKLLPRERDELLLDRDSAVLELRPLGVRRVSIGLPLE